MKQQVDFEEMVKAMAKDHAKRKNVSYNETKITVAALIKGHDEFNMGTPTARYVVSTFEDEKTMK